MALSARDRDVLGYAVRHGMVTADQLGARFFASTPSARRRLRTLGAAGLVISDRVLLTLPAVVRATPAGARLAGCDLLRQAREARVAAVVSTQQLPDPRTAHALRGALLGAGLLIAHRIGPDDADAVARVIGTERAVQVTRTLGEEGSPPRRSVRSVDRFAVDPNVMKQLATGEAVVLSVASVRRVAIVRVLRPVIAEAV